MDDALYVPPQSQRISFLVAVAGIKNRIRITKTQ
jgi:hypothetical protein